MLTTGLPPSMWPATPKYLVLAWRSLSSILARLAPSLRVSDSIEFQMLKVGSLNPMPHMTTIRLLRSLTMASMTMDAYARESSAQSCGSHDVLSTPPASPSNSPPIADDSRANTPDAFAATATSFAPGLFQNANVLYLSNWSCDRPFNALVNRLNDSLMLVTYEPFASDSPGAAAGAGSWLYACGFVARLFRMPGELSGTLLLRPTELSPTSPSPELIPRWPEIV